MPSGGQPPLLSRAPPRPISNLDRADADPRCAAADLRPTIELLTHAARVGPMSTAGDVLVDTLAANSVRHVFGLIGSATLEVFDALYRAPDIKYVGVRDERSGVAMADGYARVTRGPGIFLAGQNGPGVTNVATTLALARLAYSPVVVFGGAVSRSHAGRDAFQEIDQLSLLRPVCKEVLQLTSADRIGEVTAAALRIAQTGRKGPVFVELPRDLLAAETDSGPAIAARPQVAIVDLAAVQQAVKLIANHRRRVIVAGGGVKWADASAAVMRLAERIGACVLTSAGHRDAVDNRYPLFMGQFGPRGSHQSREVVSHAELIIGIGTRFGFNSTFYSSDFVPSSAKLIQFDLEPESLGRYFTTELCAVSDAKAIAEQLDDACANTGVKADAAWVEWVQGARTEWLGQRSAQGDDRSEPIQPQAFLRWLSSQLEEGTIVTVDAGTCGLMAAEAIDFSMPRTLLTPLDFGCLGFAHPAAIGAKLGAPDRPVVSISGDGGFGFSIAELATAVENNLAMTSLVLNNEAWGAEKAYQRDFFDGRFIGSDISAPPYDQIAVAYGAVGVRARSWSEIEAAADALHAARPTVFQVDVDPAALRSFRVDSFKHRAAAPAGA